jgi:uncharacterized LabA/DUF88 family protein
MDATRIMIFIDGSNLHWGIRGYNKEHQTNLKLNYSKLVSLLLRDRTLIRVMYYCSQPIPPSRPTQTGFFDYLRSLNIQVIEKALKIRTDPTTNAPRYVEKGVDVALATDLIGMAWEDAYDVAIIVSGDADFAGAVNKVMGKGRNVELASFARCLSRELRTACLNKTILDDYIPQIKV